MGLRKGRRDRIEVLHELMLLVERLCGSGNGIGSFQWDIGQGALRSTAHGHPRGAAGVVISGSPLHVSAEAQGAKGFCSSHGKADRWQECLALSESRKEFLKVRS